MTSDPHAPGAPAIYLNLEESADNRNHYESKYARIKVLTELGKEWATVEVPYVPGYTAMPIIEARTIHPDGTVIPLTGKPEDLLVVKLLQRSQQSGTTSHQVKAAVFNMPSVEVGSILEYKWTIPLTGAGHVTGGLDSQQGLDSSELASTIPEWDVQQPIYVRKAHYYFNPYGNLDVINYVDGERAVGLLYNQQLPRGFQVSRSPKNDYSLDVHDVPAYSKEENSPPEDSFHYRVRFFYSPYPTFDTYWDSENKRWSKELDQFASAGKAVKAAADQAVAGAPTPEAKARKLYDAVQALHNTDFSRAKSEAERHQLHMRKTLKRADDVLAEEGGSSDDLAALYLAMARAEGLEAYGMKVADRNLRIFDPNYLSLSQLDSLLVVLRIDGKDIYTDPGQLYCPFGQLAWSHTLAGGLLEGLKGPTFTPQNLTKDAVTAHTADLTVDPHGAITGTAKILMNGPTALYWRQLHKTADTDEVKKQLNESLHSFLPVGVEGEVAELQGLDTSAGYFTVVVKVQGQLGSATGKRLLLPAFFFSSAHTQFVSEDKRDNAIDLHFAEQSIDDVVYRLPAGFAVESAPPSSQLPWPEHAALVVKTQPGAGTIEIKHIYARAFVILAAKEYPALRDYYQKMATSDAQQVVLAAAATPSGN